jgi:hypothetical protein
VTWEDLLINLRDEVIPGWSYDPPGQDEYYKEYNAAIDAIGLAGDGDHVTTQRSVSQRVYDTEAARRESINTRAGALIGTAGVLGSLVVAAGQLGLDVKKGSFGAAAWVVFVFFVVSLAYLGATLVLALRVQGAQQGNVVDPTDLAPQPNEPSNKGAYDVRMTQVHLRYTVLNYRLNNLLKYRLLSSQRCLRNGVLAIIVAGVVSPAALRG